MKQDLYDIIVNRLKDAPSRKCIPILVQEFPEIPKSTLSSIASLVIQRRTKKLHPSLSARESVEKLYLRYRQDVANGDEPGVLLRLADEIGLPPALLARMILEFHYETETLVGENAITPSRMLISAYMKNTHDIEDRDLALEIYMCNLQDDFYGPYAEAVKAGIGHEFEQKLVKVLRQFNIPFCDEKDLRNRGYDKTPDIKLDVPIAVDGFVVNWIECKAVFGDPEVHAEYLKEQLWSYWNRFGSGMVIYWFGFLDVIDRGKEKGIMVRDCFPSSGVTKMNLAI